MCLPAEATLPVKLFSELLDAVPLARVTLSFVCACWRGVS